MKNKLKFIFAAIFCAVLWGSAFPAVKKGYELLQIQTTAQKLLFAGLRFSIAGAALMLLCIILQKGKIKNILPQKQNVKWVIALALVQIFLNYLFYYIGLSNTPGSTASIIAGMDTFLAVLLAPLVFKSDKLTILKLFGAVVGFIGVVLSLSGVEGFSFSLFGEGFMFISAILTSIGILLNKAAAKVMNPLKLSADFLFFGGAGLLIVGLFSGGKINFSAGGTLVLLYLCFVSAAAFALWTWVLKHNDASKMSIFKLLIPVFGNVFSALALGESILTPTRLLSLILVAAGITAVNISKAKISRKTL